MRALNDKRTEGIVLMNIALMWQESGRIVESRNTYGPAIELLRQTGARSAEAVALGNFAGLLAQTGHVAEAEPYFKRAYEITVESGNKAHEARLSGDIGVLYFDMEQFEKSEAMFTRALEIARECRDGGAEGTALGNLAHLHSVQGRHALAAEAFERALKLHRTLGARRMAAIHGCRYALCLLALGDASAAQKEYTEGMNILRELNDTLEIGRTHKEMLRACEKLGVPPLKDNGPGTP
jgi:tetratricopeptide (TPR) repeat protein